MLKRIYVDNYKCLVNFEISLENVNLFLGENGSGKSTVFEVLQRIVEFVRGIGRLEDIFGVDSRTRWQTQPVQSFELDIALTEGLFRYELSIEHKPQELKRRVKHERLWLNNKPLLRFESGEVHLYRDDHSEGPVYPFDWSQSALASIFPRHDNKHLSRFKDTLGRVVVLQILPPLMVAESAREDPRPSWNLDNYASWYRYLSHDQLMVTRLQEALSSVLPGFKHFRFEQVGEQHRLLRLYFASEEGSSTTGYTFGELSDGQRALIALHTLLLDAEINPDQNHIFCLDEPDNFVALPEIQPWLVRLHDLCQKGLAQVILISHHPEMINYLAAESGIWFEHEPNKPVRLKPITEDNLGGLPISELIARGWLNG
jgi:predicted ATPase